MRAYLYLQKVMLDKADAFAQASRQAAAGDPYLDAVTERPLSPFAANATSAEATARRAAVLRELAGVSGLLLFVDGQCGVCVRQAQVLVAAQRQYGLALLTVSLDGAAPPGLELPLRPDTGQAARLGVVGTPALFLMRPPDAILPLAQGALDLDTLAERIVAQARQAGWVDAATYAATRPVRQPFAVPAAGDLEFGGTRRSGAAGREPARAAGAGRLGPVRPRPPSSFRPSEPTPARPRVRSPAMSPLDQPAATRSRPRILLPAALLLAALILLPAPAARADMQELMDEQFTALDQLHRACRLRHAEARCAGRWRDLRPGADHERAAGELRPALVRGRLRRHRLLRRQLLVHLGRPVRGADEGVAANAAGYAFQVAMSSMCETCMAAIETLQKKIQELNQYFGNSCQLAQGIVNDTASAMGFQRVGSASVINTATGLADVFGSWTSGTDGQSPEVKAAEGRPTSTRPGSRAIWSGASCRSTASATGSWAATTSCSRWP